MNRDRAFSPAFFLNVLLAVALVISLRAFVADIRNTLNYGGVDLRNRVVGARLMLEDRDPYTFKWSEGDPETLLDPMDNPQNEVSRVTVPPTILMLQTPMANLSYYSQRIIWLLLQWIFLLLSLFLFAACADSKRIGKAVWIVGLIFSGTYIWRFHVERGQIYILFVFLVALSLWLCRRRPVYAPLLGGLVLGLAVSMRPTLILMALPMLMFRKWKLLAGVIAGTLFFVLLSGAIFGFPAWSSYTKAMRFHEKDNLFKAQPLNPDEYEESIEGMDNLQRALPFPNINTSVQWVFKDLFNLELTTNTLLAMLGGLILLIAAGLFLFRGRDVSLIMIYLTGSTIMIIAEYFLPAIKAYYGNIMWLIPFELIVLNSGKLSSLNRTENGVALFLLLTGLFFSFSLLWEGHDVLVGEGLVLLFLVWVSACFLKASQPRIELEDQTKRVEASGAA